jgi:hypothetical protein
MRLSADLWGGSERSPKLAGERFARLNPAPPERLPDDPLGQFTLVHGDNWQEPVASHHPPAVAMLKRKLTITEQAV